jgi:hypothetical protein
MLVSPYTSKGTKNTKSCKNRFELKQKFKLENYKTEKKREDKKGAYLDLTWPPQPNTNTTQRPSPTHLPFCWIKIREEHGVFVFVSGEHRSSTRRRQRHVP